MKRPLKAILISLALIAACLGGHVACRTMQTSTPKADGNQKTPKFDFDSQLGLVEVSHKNRFCLAINNPDLSEKSEVVVVFRDNDQEPQRIVTGIVETSLAASCSFEDRMRGSVPQFTSFYSLKLLNTDIEGFDVGVAIVNPTGPIAQNGSSFRIELDKDHKIESIKTCQTGEGFYLVLWSDKKYKGKCLWEAYYYLGFDQDIESAPEDKEGGCGDCEYSHDR